MLDMRLVFAAMLLSVSPAFGDNCCAPPPTTPQLAWPMTFVGQMDPTTHLQKSFDSGKRPVGAGLFPEYWYKFTLVIPPQGGAVGLSGFFATGTDFQASMTLVNDKLQIVGPLSADTKLQNGTYYVHVTASSSTHFHFGVVLQPPINEYPNSVGHTETNATDLGTLNKVLSRGSSFYTYFKRLDPTPDSPTQGSMQVNFAEPIPTPPLQTDFYTFSLPTAGPVKLICNSSPFGEPVREGPKFAAKNPSGDWFTWGNGETLQLASGKYVLKVVDQRTAFESGGIGVRPSQVEDFELYTLELLFKP